MAHHLNCSLIICTIFIVILPTHHYTSFAQSSPSSSLYIDQIAAGTATCAIQSDFTAWCWGPNFNGQLGTGVEEVQQYNSPVRVIERGPWIQIANGNNLTCGIRSDGSLWCWGDLTFGNTTARSSPVPTIMPGSGNYTQISVGSGYGCGVQVDGSGWCFGSNINGRLGTNSTDSTSIPQKIIIPGSESNSTWLAIQTSLNGYANSGGTHTCGITTTKSVYCWGDNTFSQLGTNSTNSSLFPVPIIFSNATNATMTFNQISLGPQYTCGVLTNQSAVCFGYDPLYGAYNGMASDGYTAIDPSSPAFKKRIYSAMPRIVPKGGTWSQISAGVMHYCGIKATDKSAWCFGAPKGPYLGTPDSAQGIDQPIKVQTRPGSGGWLQLSAGYNHTCGILAYNGSLWCWGYGGLGALGNGGTQDQRVPTIVPILPGQPRWGLDSVFYAPPAPPVPPDPSRIPSPPSPPPPPPPPPSSPNTTAIVGGALGGVLAAVVICAIVGFLLYRRKMRRDTAKAMESLTAQHQQHLNDANEFIKNGIDSDEPSTPPMDKGTLLRPGSSGLLTPSSPGQLSARDPMLRWLTEQEAGSGAWFLKWLEGRYPPPRQLSGISRMKAWELLWSDATIVQALTMGSFGLVFLARRKGEYIAIKAMVDAKAIAAEAAAAATADEENIFNSDGTVEHVAVVPQESLMKEVKLLIDTAHPNIVSFKGFCTQPPALAVEFCHRGSLYDVIHVLASPRDKAAVGIQLTWHRTIQMALDIAHGLVHLHSKNIVHSNIKSSNLLVTEDWVVKIADIGVVALVEEARKEERIVPGTVGCGSDPRWLAPEVMQGNQHSAKSDVWSFALVMFELLTWELPWSNVNPWGIVGLVLSGARPLLPALQLLPPMPSGRPGLEEYITLMQQCWMQDPRGRPNMSDVAKKLQMISDICSSSGT